MIVVVILLLVLLSASSIVAAWGRGFLGGKPEIVKDMVAAIDSNVCDSNLTTEVSNMDSEEDLKFFMSGLFRPNLSNTYSEFMTKCLTTEDSTETTEDSTDITTPEPCNLSDFPNAASVTGNKSDGCVITCNPNYEFKDGVCSRKPCRLSDFPNAASVYGNKVDGCVITCKPIYELKDGVCSRKPCRLSDFPNAESVTGKYHPDCQPTCIYQKRGGRCVPMCPEGKFYPSQGSSSCAPIADYYNVDDDDKSHDNVTFHRTNTNLTRDERISECAQACGSDDSCNAFYIYSSGNCYMSNGTSTGNTISGKKYTRKPPPTSGAGGSDFGFGGGGGGGGGSGN